jgi:hypothetical protein
MTSGMPISDASDAIIMFHSRAYNENHLVPFTSLRSVEARY